MAGARVQNYGMQSIIYCCLFWINGSTKSIPSSLCQILKFEPGRYDGCVGIQKEINGYKTFVILSYCHRPNLAATAEAKDLTAPTADEERGARSHPTAKSALKQKNTSKIYRRRNFRQKLQQA